MEGAMNILYHVDRAGYTIPGLDYTDLLRWWPKFKPFKGARRSFCLLH